MGLLHVSEYLNKMLKQEHELIMEEINISRFHYIRKKEYNFVFSIDFREKSKTSP